jgi:hypothetical protein
VRTAIVVCRQRSKEECEATVFRADGVVLIKVLILMVIDQHHPGRF